MVCSNEPRFLLAFRNRNVEVVQNLYGETGLECKEVIQTPFWMDDFITDE